jgi:hypothetical protein
MPFVDLKFICNTYIFFMRILSTQDDLSSGLTHTLVSRKSFVKDICIVSIYLFQSNAIVVAIHRMPSSISITEQKLIVID